MNTQELQTLEDYLLKLTHVGYVNRDPLAAQAIAVAFSRQIDAPYLAVQRCLQLEQALASANAKIAQLEQQQPAKRNQTYLRKGSQAAQAVQAALA